MNNFIKYSCFLVLMAVGVWSCEEDKTYPGGVLSDYISMLDLRDIYKGKDVVLTEANMAGATYIAGLVVSDHSGGNLPAGLLVVQDNRRLGLIRGISLQIGAAADTYFPGDSVVISVEGKTLTRIDGILQITGVTPADIKKVASNKPIPIYRVNSNLMLQFPDRYESVQAVIVKGGFNPLPAKTDQFKGEWKLNDGFGNITLHTEAGAQFADSVLPVMANYYGIMFNKIGADGKQRPEFRFCKSSDYRVLSSEIEIQSILITGIATDVKGGDGNYEYVQMMATRDIDFSVTPYSIVTTNNAGASNPTGFPTQGWATGNMRTYKINMTSGVAKQGTYFYVGGTGKRINGDKSKSIAESNWIRAYDYVNLAGEGFGAKTGGWFANSGNATGVAVFEGTTVTKDTKPVDVIFISGGGSLFQASPEYGYRITNNDWYDVLNPITLASQPYYRAGTNTLFLSYNTADLGYFYVLGGEYTLSLGRWTKARTQMNYLMDTATVAANIQDSTATQLKF